MHPSCSISLLICLLHRNIIKIENMVDDEMIKDVEELKTIGEEVSV